MPSIPFTPYWKPVWPREGPNSWVFYVVARIAGVFRPLAVVSSVGGNAAEESLQGYPLAVACERVVTVFADQANRAGIRAELALAAEFYCARGCEGAYFPRPVELPELNRVTFQPERHNRSWDQSNLYEFPFLTTCLMNGVGLDRIRGLIHPARPEPLATVYHDTSLEWGMMIVDITDLDTLRYGIVGFAVCRARFIAAPGQEKYQMGVMGPGAFETGPLRVIDDLRPRQAMSVSEYMAKFKYETPTNGDVSTLLLQTPLIDIEAMELIWPKGSENDNLQSRAVAPGSPDISFRDQAFTKLIQSTLELDAFDGVVFDDACGIPNFRKFLRRYLVEYSEQLNSTRSAGQLILLAFTEGEHLSLELLKDLSVEAISAALDRPTGTNVTSLSLCLDSVRETPSQLIAVLSRASRLRAIYFIQSPLRASDELSVQTFEQLAARPHILSRAKILLTGACSTALRKNFWLPTAVNEDTTQLAPIEVFPVQQVLIQTQTKRTGPSKFGYHNVYLGDGMLKAERLAAGFLMYLLTLDSAMSYEAEASLFSFSSAPTTLEADPRYAAEISPILPESFAFPPWPPDASDLVTRPRVRDLVPDGWTILVSRRMHWHCNNIWACPCTSSYSIQYAFVRALKQRILVEQPPLVAPSPEELEVVGLKEFLATTAPEVDPDVVDRSLHEVSKKLAPTSDREYLPPDIEPVSVLPQAEAAELLLAFLEDASKHQERLRIAMEESPNG